MPPLSSPLTSALCQADLDCGVRPLWNLKAGSPFHIRHKGDEKSLGLTQEPLVQTELILSAMYKFCIHQFSHISNFLLAQTKFLRGRTNHVLYLSPQGKKLV